ncbi:hypothetical protein JL722_12455 [Aureococcus anophagefferens]|nr:hypothetical protein JL722_12455 [Aureococcus anophagefferens]
MAELGDFICQGRVSAKEVSVEMMDYTYVDKCEDLPELRSILKELKTGTYGRYPHLEGHVEKKILNLLPPKEREIRGAREPTALGAAREESYLDESEKKDKKDRISGYDFRSWDTFDVDAECSKGAADALGVDDLAPAERAFLAAREKHKGNEAYKAGESRDATTRTAVPAHDGANAVVFANRAMASIRLGLLERAEDDCTCALKIDPDYAKARQRRGMTRHKRGKYAAAIEDLERACAEDPANEPLRKLLKQSCDKYEDVEGQKAQLKRDARRLLAIEDDDDSEEDVPIKAAPVKVAIEDDDESEEDVPIKAAPPRVVAGVADDVAGSWEDLGKKKEEEKPADADKLKAEGNALMGAGDFAGARVKALFRRAEAREGLGLAEAAGSAKRVELLTGAGLDLEAVCELEPKNDVARNRLRTVSAAMADATDAAAAAATRAAELGAFKESDAKKAAGSEKMKAGDLAGAVACYTAALELWDGNVAARNNRALARLKLEDFDGAVADASAVLVKAANLKALYAAASRRATGDPRARSTTSTRSSSRRPAPLVADAPPPPPAAAGDAAAAPPPPPRRGARQKASGQSREKRPRSRGGEAQRRHGAEEGAEDGDGARARLARRVKDPARRAYVATFKPLTLKKIDVSLMSEVFSQLIPALIEHRAPPEAAAILANAAKHKGFAVTRALLSKAETVAVTLLAAKLDDKDLAKDLAKGYGLGK